MSIVRRAPVLFAALVALGAQPMLAACSTGHAAPAAARAPAPATGATTSLAPAPQPVPGSGATSAPTTSRAPVPAPPPVSGAPPTTEALIPQESPDIAARSLFDAWSRGDRAGALHVATPAAVDALFAHPVASYSDRGCQDPISDRALCAFEVGDGLAQIGTVSLAGGWVVERVTLE
ncbi:MAG TPA: hypothetical protein VMU14_21045 [Acidimicrobiales bacterium]|nr:hypothetical protein [Acidimicrobiales bacterium]